MPFDASSAEPVGAAVAEPEFDASSATPVAEDTPQKKEGLDQFRIDPIEFEKMGTADRLKTILSHPWDKYVASVDAGFESPVKIPRVEADKGDGVVNRAGQVGAAVTNTATGAISGAISPGGVVSVTSPASLHHQG